MATATITYRKTKTGQWVAFGPADAIKAGVTVTVVKKSGQTKTERIESVGKAFRVDGQTMVYGYLDPDYRPATTARQTTPTRSRAWWDSPRERALAVRDGDPGAWS